MTISQQVKKEPLMNTKLSRTISAIAFVMLLASCGGGSDPIVMPPDPPPTPTPTPTPTPLDPASFLNSERFTRHQPDVLEQIGAHHAYARRLTGRGIRIGIDDSIVDYTQTGEFGNRVKLRAADGAVLAYPRPDGEVPFGEIQRCRSLGTCQAFSVNSNGNPEAHNLWVQQYVRQYGWPIRDDSAFLADQYYSAFDPIQRLYRWVEVPTPYREGNHGTIVASTAAGRNLGVAPEATIIPIANNLTDDQGASVFAGQTLRSAVAALPANLRRNLDNEAANFHRENYAKFDIINRSYGMSLFDPDVISREIERELRWYRTYLPRTLNAYFQTGTPEANRTILVYAAGNDGEAYSGIGADLPYYVPALRGYSISVAATDPSTGRIADYSNRCGGVPSDWNTARYGPHYCIAAPGTVRGLDPDPNNPGRGIVRDGIQGTSFAAPVVSGALALMMEHFRGKRGNTAILKRMLDTADRSGRYADLETYGAGHLDLEAALSPVGMLRVGRQGHALTHTSLQVPAAFGTIADRLETIELATFDAQEFPFWVPVSSLVSTRPVSRSYIPEIGPPGVADESDTGPGVFELHWMPDRGDGNVWVANKQDWIAGFGPGSASLSRLPGNENNWGYGFILNSGNYLGGRTSGAFGTDLRSGMVWGSRSFEQKLGNNWKVAATGTLAIAQPRYEANAMFRASPSVFSALAVRVGTQATHLTVEQPLRAESGTGTFLIENGLIEDGRRLQDEHRFSLRPDAREVRMTLRHEQEATGGRIAVELGGSMNAGHTSGEQESHIGLAYRLDW